MAVDDHVACQAFKLQTTAALFCHSATGTVKAHIMRASPPASDASEDTIVCVCVCVAVASLSLSLCRSALSSPRRGSSGSNMLAGAMLRWS